MRSISTIFAALHYFVKPGENLADAFSLHAQSGQEGRRFDLAGLAVHDRRKRGMGFSRFEVVPRHEAVQSVLQCGHREIC